MSVEAKIILCLFAGVFMGCALYDGAKYLIIRLWRRGEE